MKTETLLLIGAAAVGVYLLTRPKVPASYSPYGTLPSPYGSAAQPAYNPYGSAAQPYAGNATAQDISAGASALSSLSDVIGNFF